MDYWGVASDIKIAGFFGGAWDILSGGVGAIANALYVVAKTPFVAMGIPFGIIPHALHGTKATPEENKDWENIAKALGKVFSNAAKTIGGIAKMGYGAGEKLYDVAEWVGGQMINVIRAFSKDPKMMEAGEQATQQVKQKILGFGTQLQQAA